MFGYTNNYNNNEDKADIRDEYRTPKDRIWGDVIRHERVLELIWKDTWESSIVPWELRPENCVKREPAIKRDVIAFYNPNTSRPIPLKASEMIGWRSSEPSYSVELFNVKYTSNKKRFVKEQFGYYRELRYIQEAKTKTQEENSSAHVLQCDEKFIRHVPKRLIC